MVGRNRFGGSRICEPGVLQQRSVGIVEHWGLKLRRGNTRRRHSKQSNPPKANRIGGAKTDHQYPDVSIIGWLVPPGSQILLSLDLCRPTVTWGKCLYCFRDTVFFISLLLGLFPNHSANV